MTLRLAISNAQSAYLSDFRKGKAQCVGQTVRAEALNRTKGDA